MHALRKERFGSINETISAPRFFKCKLTPTTTPNNSELFDAPFAISKPQNAETRDRWIYDILL